MPSHWRFPPNAPRDREYWITNFFTKINFGGVPRFGGKGPIWIILQM